MAKDPTARTVEKAPTKSKLVQLHRAHAAMTQENAAQRGEYSSLVRKAVEENGVNAKALAIAISLLNIKNDSKRAYTVRHVLLYLDHYGLSNQTDIEDAIAQADDEDRSAVDDVAGESRGDIVAASEADAREVMNGHASAGDFDGVDGPRGVLSKFRETLAEPGMLSSMVTRSLAVHVKKYPHLVGELTDIANARKAALDAARPPRKGRSPKAPAVMGTAIGGPNEPSAPAAA